MRAVGRWRGPSGPPVLVWDLIKTDLISLFLPETSAGPILPHDQGLQVDWALGSDMRAA